MTLWGINRFVRHSLGTTNCPVLCKMPRKHAISCLRVTVVMLNLLSVDSWRQYHATNSVGELQSGLISPAKAIHRGGKADGILLYICRALWNGVYYIGYNDPCYARSCVAFVEHTAQVDLLVFTPNGPTFSGPTVDFTCPHFHVIQAHREVDWVEHRGPEPMPTGAVLSNSFTAVAEASGAISTVAKLIDNGNRFCMAYGITTGCQTWGHVMLTSLSYQWEQFQAGSEVPYNAIIDAYTHKNQPLYHVMKKSEDYSIGSYNAYTGKMEISYYGIKRPSVVDILTLNLL